MNTGFKTVASSHITISELMLPSHTNKKEKIHVFRIVILIKLRISQPNNVLIAIRIVNLVKT
mgnify:CR=1 FL=1